MVSVPDHPETQQQNNLAHVEHRAGAEQKQKQRWSVRDEGFVSSSKKTPSTCAHPASVCEMKTLNKADLDKKNKQNIQNLALAIAGYNPFEKRVSLITELIEKLAKHDNQTLEDLRYVIWWHHEGMKQQWNPHN